MEWTVDAVLWSNRHKKDPKLLMTHNSIKVKVDMQALSLKSGDKSTSKHLKILPSIPPRVSLFSPEEPRLQARQISQLH